MDIIFNPEKEVYEVYDGSNKEPEFEDQDFMKCITYLEVQKGAING